MTDGGESGGPSGALLVEVFEGGRQVAAAELAGTVVLGRQRSGEPPPYASLPTTDGARVVVAPAADAAVSREHVALRGVGEDRVEVRNASAKAPIRLERVPEGYASGAGAGSFGHAYEIAPRATRVVGTPARIVVGSVSVLVASEAAADATFLESAASPPRAGESIRLDEVATMYAGVGGEPDRRGAVDWAQRTLDIVQRSASEQDFLPAAAAAVLETAPLDTVAILLRDGGEWTNAAAASRDGPPADAWSPSRTMLAKVLATKRTHRRLPFASAEGQQSLRDVRALIAAPILDARGEVVGAVYGDRRSDATDNAEPAVSALDAQLVELLASAVAAGLARLEQERAAMAARVRFEQFFTPQLSEQLQADASLLKGRDAEVSLLFGDVGGFSRISERMGPEATVAWLNSAFGRLSECVAEEEGVLVDYIGDELFAMWGAPQSTPDQASRACRAALKMQRALDDIDREWSAQTGEPMRFGVGVNTGVARVGNVGSLRKFKYGPLGSPVNIASRCQGATKHLRTPVLVTGQTASRLDPGEFALRRLCKLKVVNIEEAIDAYELAPEATPAWRTLKAGYEEALDAFEQHDYLTTAKILGGLVTAHPGDGPAILLLSRAVDRLAAPTDAPRSTVLELSSK